MKGSQEYYFYQILNLLNNYGGQKKDDNEIIGLFNAYKSKYELENKIQDQFFYLKLR